MLSIPFTGDKIFILQVGMVITFRMVVLVWFTGILSEYAHALIRAENRTKTHIYFEFVPICRPRMSQKCERGYRYDCGQRLTMSLVGLPIYTILWGL